MLPAASANAPSLPAAFPIQPIAYEPYDARSPAMPHERSVAIRDRRDLFAVAADVWPTGWRDVATAPSLASCCQIAT